MRLVSIALALSLAAPVAAQDPGDFDYYVMALSWSPSWCAETGDARDAPQCDRELGWVLHGLWPQYERGYPQDCARVTRDPSRSDTAAMTDIMGSGSAAWYQWQKHGRCAGVTADAYFDLARQAYDSVERPAILRQIEDTLRLPPSVIEDAFLEVNPAFQADGITITCKDGRIQEARICLTKNLTPRSCGADVIRDCSRPADLPPIR